MAAAAAPRSSWGWQVGAHNANVICKLTTIAINVLLVISQVKNKVSDSLLAKRK
jgi:hypothetical protein